MQLVNELLGFAVLSGPLWLVVALLALGIWVAFKAVKRFKSTIAKILVGIATVALVLLVPFADEIVGRIYLSHLCTTEAGVKVYQIVELPKEYWNEEGTPRLRTFKSKTPGIITEIGTSEPFLEEFSFTEPYNPSIHIEKAGFRLREIESKKIVGEVVYFRYWGGWVARNFSPHNSALSCELAHLDQWENKVFKRSTTNK